MCVQEMIAIIISRPHGEYQTYLYRIFTIQYPYLQYAIPSPFLRPDDRNGAASSLRTYAYSGSGAIRPYGLVAHVAGVAWHNKLPVTV